MGQRWTDEEQRWRRKVRRNTDWPPRCGRVSCVIGPAHAAEANPPFSRCLRHEPIPMLALEVVD